MKSIVSNVKECIVCGRTDNLHRHHVFYGNANRSLSEEHGCWVYLCGFHHNMSNHGVHFDKKLDLKLKQMCQLIWEEKNGTRDDFRKVFGKNYL